MFTLATIVAGNGDNLSPNSATVEEKFGNYSRQCGQGFSQTMNFLLLNVYVLIRLV